MSRDIPVAGLTGVPRSNLEFALASRWQDVANACSLSPDAIRARVPAGAATSQQYASTLLGELGAAGWTMDRLAAVLEQIQLRGLVSEKHGFVGGDKPLLELTGPPRSALEVALAGRWQDVANACYLPPDGIKAKVAAAAATPQHYASALLTELGFAGWTMSRLATILEQACLRGLITDANGFSSGATAQSRPDAVQLIGWAKKVFKRELLVEELDAAKLSEALRAEGPSDAALRGLSPELEAIVRHWDRPALFVRGGSFDVEGELKHDSANHNLWAEPLTACKSHLETAIRSVGRVDVSGHPQLDWVGTAWLVAPDVVVTNRHVAIEFAAPSADGRWTFVRPGGLFPQVTVSIGWNHEMDGSDAPSTAVKEILYIAGPQDADIALLRLAEVPAGRHPLMLSSRSAVLEKTQIAVIGYPARDSRQDPIPMARVFLDVYDVKRLQPGLVLKKVPSTVTVFLHDASTLGGNSGSVVLDMRTGEAVGLHFAGKKSIANYAVTASVVADLLRAVLKPSPRAGVASVPVVLPSPVDATESSIEQLEWSAAFKKVAQLGADDLTRDGVEEQFALRQRMSSDTAPDLAPEGVLEVLLHVPPPSVARLKDHLSLARSSDKWRTGDIVLYSGTGRESIMLKRFQWSCFSHVGVIVEHGDEPFVLESTDPIPGQTDIMNNDAACGVHLWSLKDTVDKYPGTVVVRRLCVAETIRAQMNDKVKARVSEIAAASADPVWRHENLEYPSQLRLFGEAVLALDWPKSRKRTFFCSQLVAWAYQQFGLLSMDRTATTVLPIHFSPELALTGKHSRRYQLPLLGSARLADELLVLKPLELPK